MLTEFGKCIRKIRIDKAELLKDMAEKLQVTSAYLSAVEHGKREIPDDWIRKICKFYDLSSIEMQALLDAADQSRLMVKFDLRGRSKDESELINAFARKLDRMSGDDIEEMYNFLTRRGDDK